MRHTAHLAGDHAIGWRVVCACGWISDRMGQGDAWTTMQRRLADVGHAAWAQASA